MAPSGPPIAPAPYAWWATPYASAAQRADEQRDEWGDEWGDEVTATIEG